MDYRTENLGNLCEVIKGNLGISKAIPGPYPLVTTGSKGLSHVSYQFDKPAVCIPLISSAGHGKASLNYVHFQEGKFALGNILCACIPYDDTLINAKYLQLYLQSFKDQLIVPLMKGTANVSLSIEKIKTIEVQIPPPEVQEKIMEYSYLHEQIEKKIDSLASHTNRLWESIIKSIINGNGND